ncbi:GNAT family N-acetyltransferase [Ensifer sp. 22564]|jgi:ribosomal protein S18 acetylase RimI-like enzyme|uniref:GNAT family N-acetyltransferase n=1 Tax=unclassified Ensifer TaxID=2633371 RepID=UPI003F87CDE4
MRFRFLGGIREVSRERLLSMTKVDHRSTENFLAFGEDSETIIATAIVACDASTKRAEVAVSVRAEYKHMGVAWEMLRHVARFAEASGAKSLESLESRANHEAIELEREQGFIAVPYADDPTLILVRKDLRQG